jgi:hypothetical protein
MKLAALIAAGAVVAAAAAVAVTGATTGSRERLLPDLDELAPGGVDVRTVVRPDGRRRVRLGFSSATSNGGEGPLAIVATRRPGRRAMRVRQLVRRRGAPPLVHRGAGVLRFEVASDHRHWHLEEFQRFELRRATDGKLVRRPRKAGFCLGDRFADPRLKHLPNRPRAARWTHRCGLDRRTARRMRQGISVGYGDIYHPYLEGQAVDITGLPAGRYLLIHRANPRRRLLESDYANNASSLLLRIGAPRHGAAPTVQTLATCPDSARCGGFPRAAR